MDKRSIVPIFRIPFDNLSMNEAVARTENFINSSKFHLVTTVNLDFLTRMVSDSELYEIIKSADMVTADGMPIVWASKLLPGVTRLKERVTGSDLTPRLAEMAAREGWPILFFGGDSADTKKAAEKMRRDYSGVKISIAHCEFSPLLEINHMTLMEEIHEVKPKMIFMFLGTKAEKWASMNRLELAEAGVRMAIGVGSTVKFLAGSVQRAPKWMQDSGLEWFFRLCQEPGYLWKRYAKNLVIFSLLFVRQFLRSSLFWLASNKVPEFLEESPKEMRKEKVWKVPGKFLRLILHGRLSITNVADWRELISNTLRENQELKVLEIDLSHLRYLDSAVMDFLINLHCDLRGMGKILNISRISPEIARIFTSSRMHQYLNMKFQIEIGELREKFGDLPVPKTRSFTFYRIAKRLIDTCGAIVGLTFLFFPAFLLIGILIKKEDSGQIFFRQVRVGRDGIPFYFWKFRSMCLDAEDKKKDLIGKAEVSGKIFKMKNDPRITKVGRFIRKASIDEFPQFLSVFFGVMSLVGPRPAANYEVRGYVSGDYERLRDMKPGITGLAQIYERHNGKLGFEEQLKLDLEYIQKRSLWLDIKLIFKTIPAILFPRGAC